MEATRVAGSAGGSEAKFLLLKLPLTCPRRTNAKLREELTQVRIAERQLRKRQVLPGRRRKRSASGSTILTSGWRRSRSERTGGDVGGLAQGGRADARPLCALRRAFQPGRARMGFADTGALWRSGYDMTPEQFSADLERLWAQVEPLYKELHAYVRHKLVAEIRSRRRSVRTA